MIKDVRHLLKAANTLPRDAMASESTSSHSISCLETAFRREREREREREGQVLIKSSWNTAGDDGWE